MSLRHQEQTRDTLALQFRQFARNECRQSSSPFYEMLCGRIAEDADLLDLARGVRRGQRAPNMLLAAVQYLVLTRGDDPIMAVYDRVRSGVPAGPGAFETFRAFCLDNAKRVAGIISTRTVQTNEVRRCALFLPALFLVEEEAGARPFHFVDVGCSAGLNLLWDRYYYRYSNGERCGNASSAIALECDIVGDGTPPLRKTLPTPTSRVGIELEPVDVSDPDSVTWLKSLIWPDQPGRAAVLDAAIAVFRQSPPRIVAGDCVEEIPRIVEDMPDGEPVCLLFSYSANQAFKDGRRGLSRLLEGLSGPRTIYEISIGNFGGEAQDIFLSRYERGRPQAEQHLGTCHPHGAWLRWDGPNAVG